MAFENKRHLALFAMRVIMLLDATTASYINNSPIPNNDDDTDLSLAYEDRNDCLVHETCKSKNWPDDPLTFLAFIEYGEVLTCKITFKGQDKDVSYDKIVLSHDEIKLYKVRFGYMTETPIPNFLNTAGWTLFNISMDNEFILKYWDTTAVNYTIDFPVDYIFVHGSNTTTCTDNTPTWYIQKYRSSIIPLEPSRQALDPLSKITHVLTLESNNDFKPCVKVGVLEKCLSLIGRYELHIEILATSINIYHKNKGIRKEITSYPNKGIKFMDVTSSYSSFSASLNISRRKIGTSDELSIAEKQGASNLENEPGASIVSISIITILSLTILLIVVVVLFIHRRRMFEKLSPEKSTRL